ncbi:MAG: CBS domain-containing protein [Planctomycetota bacterium]
MNGRTKRIEDRDVGAVRVRDAMRSKVQTLDPDDTIEIAVERLEEQNATGAPVVDRSGRLLGVLSLRDVARSGRMESDRVTSSRSAPSDPIVPEDDGFYDDEEEVYSTPDERDALLGRVRVAEWMTPGVVTTTPDATVAEVCRTMVAESIHRVFVVEGGRLCGVVSTTDVVRLVAGHRTAE